MPLTRLRMAEAQRVHDAYALALSYLGYEVANEAFGLFASVNPDNLEATSGRYLRAMLALAREQRDLARRLGIAYYRLMRALFTDRTFALPGEKPAETTLGALRVEFLEIVAEAVPKSRMRPTPQARKIWNRAGLGDPIPALDTREDDFVIKEEKWEWPTDLTEEQAAKTADTRLKGILDELAKRRAEREAKAKEAYEAAATRQAGIIQKDTMNAGRAPVLLSLEKDQRALGYVRVSKTGDPCHFCAMLISRGAVYKSEKTALFGEDGELYHDNCNCTAIPVFSKEQYADPRFDLNRELNALWKKHIQGRYSGKDARNEWRKIIREWKVNRKLDAA